MDYLKFEKLKEINSYGEECRLAKDLYSVLKYSNYDEFESALEKSVNDCKKNKQVPYNHFFGIKDTVNIKSGIKYIIDNIKLSRYACYLIIQNSKLPKQIA